MWSIITAVPRTVSKIGTLLRRQFLLFSPSHFITVYISFKCEYFFGHITPATKFTWFSFLGPLKILIWQILIYYCFNKRTGSYFIPSSVVMVKLFSMTVVWLQVYSHHKTHNTTFFFFLKSINFDFEHHDSLSHKHLPGCSQKNTIISFSKLIK